MITNILEYLEATVVAVPDKIAFSDGTDSLTHRQLYDAARSGGSRLISLGCGREPVMVIMDKHPCEVAAFLSVIYAGGFYVPVDAEMPPLRMQSIAGTTRPRFVICDDKNIENARRIPNARVITYEELVNYKADDVALGDVRRDQLDTDPIYIVFTSGSTGVPKGVLACHRSVIDYTENLSEALHFGRDNVFGNQTPLYFDAPLKEIMPTLKFGATTYFIPRRLFMFPLKLVEYLNEHRINTVCWVVSALTMISSLGALDKVRPEYLKTVAFGSEVFPKKQYNIWRHVLPEAVFYNLYGPTEATGMSCWWRADRELDDEEPIPVGRPFRNTRIYLIDDNGHQAAPGETGEIYIGGTCVTMGYYDNPDKTGQAFVQNPLVTAYRDIVYKTGDMGRYNDYGELVFVSRRDYQIKHMGHRIELGEIEAAADRFDGVARSCCLYDNQKRRIRLFYVGDAAVSELTSYLKGYLPRYMLPAEVTRLESLPLTPNGKLDRRALEAQHE